MLRSEEMTRTVVVGSIESLDVTIECLYELGILHLIDFTKQDEEFKLGQPLSKASDASQKLLKLRSMIRALEIENHRPGAQMSVKDIGKELEHAMVTLDLNTSSKAEARQKIQSLIREKEAEIKSLEPVKTFGVPVENYEGYESLSVFVGTCKQDPEEALDAKVKEFELLKLAHKAEFSVAVFVSNDERPEVVRILAEHGFQETKLPKLVGDPAKLIERLRSEIADLEKDLARIEKDIESIRKQFADFIIASEEHLAIEVLKAETPLRIATSTSSFVIDGWIPTSRVNEIQTALDTLCCGLAFVETVRPEKEEEPPVKLKNPRVIRPFEFFINLVSTPKYDEIDPTLVLFITFPLFFGFMIGDLGFGVCLMALGAVMRIKLKGSPDLYKLGTIIFAGGLIASIFGTFVFGEAFGVPFHHVAGEEGDYTWESVLNIPLHPLLDKMHDIQELLGLSLLAGWVHLSLGLAFGFFNNLKHNIRHALGKIAWLVVLFGIAEEIMAIAGDATQTSTFLNSTVFAIMPSNIAMLVGVKVSVSAVVVILLGVIALPFTEGPLALSEVIGLFTNLVSYARLAAIAVGKGAMALAFNVLMFPLIFESGNIGIAIAGVAALFITQAFFVFFLGALSAGIQAIRLNYVEFFLKFFEGGGTEFQPLSYERKYSVATK
jgi:V/A-type H+-transporting ATPase subunit I